MKRLLTTLVILTGLIGSAGAVWADAQIDVVKGYKAEQAGNYAEAVKWYRKAAEQGYAKAQYNLGNRYANGEGVLQDTIAAHMWFNIAAIKGDAVAAKNRGVVAKNLSSSDIVKAQKRAKLCTAWGYKGCDFID